MNPFLIVIPAFLTCLIVGYTLRELSLRDLQIEQAGTLVMVLRPIRVRFVIGMLSIGVLFLIIRFTFAGFAESPFVATVFVFLFAVVIIHQVAVRLAIVRARLPDNSARLYSVSQVLDSLAYGSLFLGMALATLGYGQ